MLTDAFGGIGVFGGVALDEDAVFTLVLCFVEAVCEEVTGAFDGTDVFGAFGRTDVFVDFGGTDAFGAFGGTFAFCVFGGIFEFKFIFPAVTKVSPCSIFSASISFFLF